MPQTFGTEAIPEEKVKAGDAAPKESHREPTEAEVKEFFMEAKRLAQMARFPREATWTQAWDLYNGYYDWSTKADWQSKYNIPKVRSIVDKAAGTFRRALLRVKKFYSIESESKLGTQKGYFTQMIMDYWLDKAGFVEQLTNGLKAGLITSQIVLKVWWKWEPEDTLDIESTIQNEAVKEFGLEVGTRAVEKKKVKHGSKIVGKLGIQAIDPFKFWIVPNTNGTAVIEKTEASIADLDALVEKGIYDREAVERLKQSASSNLVDADLGLSPGATKYYEAQRKGELSTTITSTGYIRTVDLFHYWGDIYDKDGSVIMRNCTFTMANNEHLLRKPRPNPFFHGKPPYVWGTPYIVPFSNYNRGIVEDISGLAKMITELANLVIDGAQFDAAKAFELDVDLIYNAAEAEKGIYPGSVFRKKGLLDPTGQRPLIKVVDTGKVPQEAMQILSYLDKELQEASAVTEFTGGYSASSGARKTATEVQTKAGQGLANLDEAARTVEETVINPLLSLCAKTIYQFHDNYAMPRLVENFPQTTSMLRGMSPEERYATMVGGFEFEARGVSIMMDKAQSLSQITQFLQTVANIPGVIQRLNIDAVLEEILMGFGYNPQKMLIQQPASVSAAGQQPPGVQLPADQPSPSQAVNASQGASMGGEQNNPMAQSGAPQQQGGGMMAMLQALMQRGGQG